MEKYFVQILARFSVRNNVYSVACRDGAKPVPASRPISNRLPTPRQPVPKPPIISSKCGVPEPVVRTEILGGNNYEKAYYLKNGTALAVPFKSSSVGEVNKIKFGQTGSGEHFYKTIIISKCKGVYNPEDYDYKTSTDICVITGLELSFSIITGRSRADHPMASYRCVLEPNTQYYINIFQYDSGGRSPYVANKRITCRTNTYACGVRVSIR